MSACSFGTLCPESEPIVRVTGRQHPVTLSAVDDEPFSLQQMATPVAPRRRVWPFVVAAAVGVVLVVGVSVGVMLYATSRPAAPTVTESAAPMAGLLPACHEEAKLKLRAPGTARFGGETTAGTDPYVVSGWVDSENGFGALVRNRYECTAWRGTDWRVQAVDFSDW